MQNFSKKLFVLISVVLASCSLFVGYYAVKQYHHAYLEHVRVQEEQVQVERRKMQLEYQRFYLSKVVKTVGALIVSIVIFRRAGAFFRAARNKFFR